MRDSQVLIVDDDATLLQALSGTVELRMDGVAVDTSDSPHAALDRIAATDYDAIVTDIKMPGMDGLELLAQIRKLRPDTPTLLITGHGEHDLAIQALRGGAHDYVQKPIDRDYFVSSLGHAIEVRHLSRQVGQQRLALEQHAKELEECLQDRPRELREFFHREEIAHAEAERAERRSALLASASKLLAGSLDYETTVASVARLAAPVFAGWCIVDLLQDDGSVRRLLGAPVDPVKEALARALQRHQALDPSHQVVSEVIRTGQPRLLSEPPDAPSESVVGDAEQQELVRELGARSVLVVPIVARGQTLGAITFVPTDRDRRYGSADVMLADDIASRCALAIDNARLHREAQEAHQQRETFISMIAHDLAQPLTAIRGYADILGRSNVSQEVQERARSVIRHETGRMARLVEDLADAAHLAAGRFQIQPVPCDLAEIAREQVDLARARIERHTLHLDAPADMVLAMCDHDRIAQVLSNLLANAITYTTDGEIRVHVWVEGEQARLAVSDEGPGIPPDRLDVIFEPHRRLADDGAGDEPKGAGLGLHIAKGIVEAHGGRIWVENAERRGATFNLSLPLVPTTATVRA